MHGQQNIKVIRCLMTVGAWAFWRLYYLESM